ncbi:MAG TPA: SRPBCC domain-containing protein [Caulobacteraceae bacterium]|nr:SRPBCC domain-containing protein [Caulobacteraceae bacterium]
MRTLALISGLSVAIAVGVVATGAAAQSPADREPAEKTPDVVETSFVTADGARDLQQSIIIDAPVSVLWKAFTDSAEFVRWGAPVASIDMKVGGRLEASYDASHPLGDPDNIVHRIITFIPERLIVFQNVQAPRMLPHAEAYQRTVVVMQYEPLGPARTRVTETVTGWGADPASNQLYAFFRVGNASVLEKMKHVYEAK